MQKMINRKIKKTILARLEKFPAVALLGPRQAGKTTLSKTFSTRYYDLDMERTVPYTAEDIRFTAKDKVIYASCLAWPEEDVKILSLGKKSAPEIEIESVSMLGSDEDIKWHADEEQLSLIPPKIKPCEHVFVFKISLK